ncbi:MAG: TetR family transcriptional regulator, partial [Candidatus Acidiferrales bacterium]
MTNGIPTQTISKQQARSETTRRKLLEAAEKVFVRDGFEAARLEDIAASAGYTRGAFYANFEDKADCFFQLLELWVGERIAEVHALIE